MVHTTVLRDEAVALLAPEHDATIIDATLGSGGHTQAIADRLGPDGRILACDVDPQAIADAQSWIGAYDVPITTHHMNFASVHTLANEDGFTAADGILADLGWRSEQFHEGGRGFSFHAEEPLHMTFGSPADYVITAADIINEWDESDIANVLYGYGEERYARRIARAIVATRQAGTIIETAKDLADVIASAVPSRYANGRIHPATKSFQALRIAVNDELTVLDDFITAAHQLLAPGGRLVIITFHSLEDRIVKHRFRELAQAEQATVLTKKPILPSAEECTQNPRARSAKLRAIAAL